MSPEDQRLAHLAAEQSTRESAVPAPRAAAAVPDHEAEVMAAHGCVPGPAASVTMGVTPSSGG